MSAKMKHDRESICRVIVDVIHDATDVDPIFTQGDLTSRVNAALQAAGADEGYIVPQSLINTLVYRATMRSKQMYPGFCIQQTSVYGYRLVDWQLVEEIKASRRMFATSLAKKRRSMATVDVDHAGPEARHYLMILKSSLSMDEEAMKVLDQIIVTEPAS